jgi:hypothetical protein
LKRASAALSDDLNFAKADLEQGTHLGLVRG